MNKQRKKCVNCDCATYRSAKDCRVKDAKRGDLCLYCTKHCKVIGERFICDDWTAVKGGIWYGAYLEESVETWTLLFILFWRC